MSQTNKLQPVLAPVALDFDELGTGGVVGANKTAYPALDSQVETLPRTIKADGNYGKAPGLNPNYGCAGQNCKAVK